MNTVHRLHIITNDEILCRREFCETTRVLAGFNVTLHLRTRTLSGSALYALAVRVRNEVPDAAIVINDRVDVALAARAAGVHLPETGLPAEVVGKIWGTRLMVGRSVHDSDEARATLQAGADYVALGPIWRTTSHPDRPAIGTRAIQAVKAAPVIAIGGVTPARVGQCLAAGAHGVAVISAFWHVPDPGAAIERFRVSFDGMLGSGSLC